MLRNLTVDEQATIDFIKSLVPLREESWRFRIGQTVCKTKGSNWHGTIVGFYTTDLTAKGYAVESYTEKGSVQIYPEAALTLWNPEND